MSVKQVAILGSTGSIGVNTLDVIRAHPERFKVTALTAAKQIDRLAEQCIEFKPSIAVVADADGENQVVGHEIFSVNPIAAEACGYPVINPSFSRSRR